MGKSPNKDAAIRANSCRTLLLLAESPNINQYIAFNVRKSCLVLMAYNSGRIASRLTKYCEYLTTKYNVLCRLTCCDDSST